MNYGIDLINFGHAGDARIMADLARDAEQAGWDGFFIWDHLALPWPAPFVDVTVALTAIALATERIRFGALMTPLPRRRPTKFARETVSLDRLSGGRLIVGAVIGAGGPDFEQIGEEGDAKTRAAMLDEGLEVLIGLWQGEPFSYAGKYYTLREATFLPTPLQQPRIPIWTGGIWPGKAAFRRAARWDGIYPIPPDPQPNKSLPPEAIHEVRNYVQSYRENDQPFDLVAFGNTPGEDPARGAAIVASYIEAGATWWNEPIHELRSDFEAKPKDSPTWGLEAMRERIRQGPPKAR